MTYKELLNELLKLNPERLEDTVTVYEPYEDEYISVIDTDQAVESQCDVLDDGHFVLIMKG